MPFDFFLEPSDRKEFDTRDLDEMDRYIVGLPHHKWPDRSYTIFRTEQDRDVRLSLLLSSEKDDYLNPQIALAPDSVLVSVVGEPVTDRMLREFVLWCQERWNCTLFDVDIEVSADALLLSRGSENWTPE